MMGPCCGEPTKGDLSHLSSNHSVWACQPLLGGVAGAQLVHILAMHNPLLRDTLDLAPVSIAERGTIAVLASSILIAMEFDKWRDGRKALSLRQA